MRGEADSVEILPSGEVRMKAEPSVPIPVDEHGLPQSGVLCDAEGDVVAEVRDRAVEPEARTDLNAAGDRVVANRKRRGWPSARDLLRTTAGILEEGGEFERARRRGDVDAQADALLDLMVFCLGGLRILGQDVEKELTGVLDRNEIREHEGNH